MRKLVVTLSAVLLLACATNNVSWDKLNKDQRSAALDQISVECGIARSTFILHGGEELEIKPDPGARYESVDCALKQLIAYRVDKMGFVGNEAFVGNTQ